MLALFPLSATAEEGFTVKFMAKKALFSGQVNSEETAQALARAVKEGRPDVEIVNKGIRIKPDMQMPNLNDLSSVITEIGVSTHEGIFSMNDESITISGLTDSLITTTALMIRLEPIKGNRRIISRICIVPTDDLPDIPIILADGKEIGLLLDFDAPQTEEYFFELPGVDPGKLVSLVMYISKTPALGGSQTFSTGGTKPGRLRAMPVIVGGDTGKQSPGAAKMDIPKPMAVSLLGKLLKTSLNTPPPKPSYVELSPILFSRNTFLLQANQDAAIAGNAKQLQSASLVGKQLIIRSMKPQSGSDTFNEWLCERRGEEVKKFLSQRGVSSNAVKYEIVNSRSTVDNGEVRVIVVIPPPAPEPEVPVEDAPAVQGGTPIQIAE